MSEPQPFEKAVPQYLETRAKPADIFPDKVAKLIGGGENSLNNMYVLAVTRALKVGKTEENRAEHNDLSNPE